MRYLASEQPYLLGHFASGDTVTIEVYDLATSTQVPVTSSACSEIGTTGVFKWSTSQITTQPTARTEYLWIMSTQASKRYGKILLGGYPAETVTKLDAIQADLDDPDRYKADVSNLDVAVSSRSSHTPADVRAEADAALAAYDPPTKTELDAAVSDLPGVAADSALARKMLTNRQELTGTALTTFDDDGTLLLTQSVADKDDGPVQFAAGDPVKRGKGA